jgi:hypothetical protein
MVTNDHHNIWTLTKHVAGSINKAAAKVDVKIYGHTVTQTQAILPPSKPHAMLGISDVFIGIFALIMFGVMIFGWMNRFDNAVDRVFPKK